MLKYIFSEKIAYLLLTKLLFKHYILPTFTIELYNRLNHLVRLFKSILILFLLISLTILKTTVFAQHTYTLDQTTRFDKMGVKDGLSSEYTQRIYQDKYGFIWIGTQFGLNLYDGNEVKIFNSDPKNPHSIFKSYTNSIFEETDGTIWFGNTGLNKYNRANQTFSNYIPDTSDIHKASNSVQKILQDGDFLWVDVPNDLYRFNKKTSEFTSFAKDTINPSKGIYSSLSSYMFIDRQGVLWITSSEVGDDFELNRFNKDTETFTHFINDSSDPESFVGKEVMSMMEDKDGIIWLATRGGGLLEITDKENGKFRQYVYDDKDSNSIIHNNLIKVFEDTKGNIWVGGENGFSLFNKKTGKFSNFRIPKQTKNPDRPNAIKDFIEGENGEFWLLSWEGFFHFQPSTKKLLHYLNNPDNQNSLSDNYVLNILIDQTGQLWVVTWHNGINRINPYTNSFRRIQRNLKLKNSLSSNYVSRIFSDSKGNFWAGCYVGGGLNKTKINSNKVYKHFEHYLFDADDPNSISDNSINSIAEDKKQTIWIGTPRGLNRYNAKDNSFTRFQHKPNDSTSISNNSIEAIFEDSHGVFWIGTRYGLNIMDRQSGKFTQFVPHKNRLVAVVGAETRVIFEDSFGDLWFGGSFLKKLNRKDTSFVSFFSDAVGLHDFSLSGVWNIAEDDSTNLWISTVRDGLYKYNRNDSSLTAFTTSQGLPSNKISTIEIDNKGYIWVSSIHGLSRIDPIDYSINNYDDADGLLGLEFIDRSSYKDKDGWLYFGTRHGINVFHPDSIKENTCIPPVYITSLTVAGNQKYFDKPLFEMQNIELNYNENDFSFDFVALNYINPQKNQFAYMLEGYDKDWIYVGNKRTANYTNMSPGKYTFWVKASNNDGYWNEDGASLIVIIHPPFWRTWWAYVIYVLTFFGLLYLVRRNEIKKINLRQELEIKQVHTDQLEELNIEKNKFFSNISHEFRTPLTLILGPLDRFIGKLKTEEEKQELNLVRRNARRLQTLINQLLSLSKLESGKMKLRAQSENIVKLTKLFLQSFHSMAHDKGIKLEFESDSEEYMICVDTLKFEKVVNNLLSNAFKFTERGGKLKLSIRNAERESDKSSVENSRNGINILFSDTGIGIQKEDLPHVFDRFYQVDEQQMKTNLGTGIGLSLTKELIELHHGTITVDSEAGMGTTFTIFLPTGKDHLSEDEIIETTNGASEMDDELLNDDYLFVQDAVSKTELKTDLLCVHHLPLLLIVEDNDDMRSYIKSYLVNSYQILEASNGKEGAEIAIEQLPDLIVSDLMMPIMDGNEMTQQLKNDERTSHIPIILLTAKSSSASKLEGLETGADDFLTKPFDAEELLVRIKNLIEGRRKLRALLSQHIGDVAQTRIIKDSSGKAMSKLDQQFLEKAKNLIDEHMANPDFSVEMLAQEMAMSRVQLHRKLKSLTDNSASDLMRNLRLKRAAELLKEGELNVTQVSYEVGISSLSYFAKAFKEQYGVTPSEYS